MGEHSIWKPLGMVLSTVADTSAVRAVAGLPAHPPEGSSLAPLAFSSAIIQPDRYVMVPITETLDILRIFVGTYYPGHNDSSAGKRLCRYRNHPFVRLLHVLELYVDLDDYGYLAWMVATIPLVSR